MLTENDTFPDLPPDQRFIKIVENKKIIFAVHFYHHNHVHLAHLDLVELWSSIACETERGLTPLCVAIKHGYKETIECLLKVPGCQANEVIRSGEFKGHNAFTVAYVMGKWSIAKKLLESDPSLAEHVPDDRLVFDGSTVFILEASISGNLEILTDLLNINPSLSEYRIRDKYNVGHTALTLAIANHRNYQPEWSRVNVIKCLLKHNPHLANMVITEGRHQGHTPLTLACSQDQFNREIVDALLDAAVKIPAGQFSSPSYIIREGEQKTHNAFTLKVSNFYFNNDNEAAIIKRMLIMNTSLADVIFIDPILGRHKSLTYCCATKHEHCAKVLLECLPSMVHQEINGESAYYFARGDSNLLKLLDEASRSAAYQPMFLVQYSPVNLLTNLGELKDVSKEKLEFKPN